MVSAATAAAVQSLHLNPSARDRRSRAVNLNTTGNYDRRHINKTQRQRMAHRNQVSRAFRRLNARKRAT